MTRYFYVLMLSAAILTTPAGMNFRKVATKDMRASVLLRMKTKYQDKDGKDRIAMGGCSGTYISPTQILTAAHCFESYHGQPVSYIWARGTGDVLGYPVHLKMKSVSQDLALVEAPFPHHYVAIGAPAEAADEVLNIGSPLNFEFVVSQGVVGVAHFHMKEFTSDYIITTAMINPGSSGGGAFNRKGQLIGVNTMTVGLFGWQGISMAVGVDSIQEFLKNYKEVK